MLYRLDGRKIAKTPYPETLGLLRRMTVAENRTVRDQLSSMIEGNEIHTAGWMPGRYWEGTPFMPIYEKAAKLDFGLAAKIFGILVFDVFRERPDEWIVGRFEKDGETLSSLTYFRKQT